MQVADIFEMGINISHAGMIKERHKLLQEMLL
jgi:hypothetical protein